MILIGLTGGIGHGKTTLADDLAAVAPSAVHLESSDLIIEVANALRTRSGAVPEGGDVDHINEWLQPLAGILEAVVHCRTTSAALALSGKRNTEHPDYYEKLFAYFAEQKRDPALQEAVITQGNKAQFRSLLQWLGGYLVKMADDGIWYDELLRRAAASRTDLATIGGVRFPGDAERITAAGGAVVAISRPDIEATESHDLTERERGRIKPDVRVSNDGDLTQLSRLAKQLYADLRAGAPRPEYRASDY